MENILVAKIIEAENNAIKIILDSKNQASHLVEEYKKIYNQEKKQIEKKYDDMLILSQDTIKNEFDKEFDKKMQESKKEIDVMKLQSKQNFDTAINILLSGVEGNGNS